MHNYFCGLHVYCFSSTFNPHLLRGAIHVNSGLSYKHPTYVIYVYVRMYMLSYTCVPTVYSTSC